MQYDLIRREPQPDSGWMRKMNSQKSVGSHVVQESPMLLLPLADCVTLSIFLSTGGPRTGYKDR